MSAPASLQAERPVRAFRRPLTLAAGWLLFTVGLAWFIYAASVRVGAGHWLGQRLRVRVIWSRFLDFLADHGANSLMVGLVVLMAVMTLLGSLALLWWVLGQRAGDAEPPVTPDAS
ncbi:MAG: hypothetical protein M3Z20_08010 [Chloroflexota bacterium]|nr:hypothetical protein [Chloroflexota bacterium]